MRTLLSQVLIVTFALIQAQPSAVAEDVPNFNRDVRPLLSDRCLSCHGPDADHREADLRLDDAESALADRGGYRVIAPGNPAGSALIERITSTDPDLRMPPPESGKTLSPSETDTLRRWIESGAEYQPHWAYVPPRRTERPQAEPRGWISNQIDHFILSRLSAEGLTPAADADPVTLIRRLSFDLTGLPPEPELVKDFAANPTASVYETIVDRMLASDACAERLAMYWLDLVRYADTVGYHGDQDHNISPYRDWVIDAFATNMRFDDFTRAQLAGDLLPQSTIDDRIASGYNRLLQTSHEGGVQPKEYLAIYAADRVRNVSAVWMGATVGCAQCHDHKYDPYTAKDFYALSAFFADLDEEQHFRVGSNALPTRRPPEIKVLTRRERARIERLKSELSGAISEAKAEQLKKQIAAIESQARMTMISATKEPRTTRILPRGNWLDESGPVVQPAVPEFLGSLPGERRQTRLDLANWLTNPRDGAGLLTARVFANRFWYLMFGRGISPSLDDFGGQGFPPDHPELLDDLAIEFVDSGWNVRHILKLIATSHTYRQSSRTTPQLREQDPTNRFFARQNAFRLPAEMVRDTSLAISGLLVRKVGGPSVKPPQPAGYYRHLNFPTRKYKADTDERQWRRGLYVHWQRQFLHPMLKAFDAPTREECTAQRPRSNTPLAALTLLNDPSFVEAARGLAERIMAASTGDAERLRAAMWLAVNREPDARELAILKELLAESRRSYLSDRDAATKLVGEASENVAESAAWVMLARAILNLDEVITRN